MMKPNLKLLWVVVWPDKEGGRPLTQGVDLPAAFFTREDAERFLCDSGYRIARIVVYERKGAQ